MLSELQLGFHISVLISQTSPKFPASELTYFGPLISQVRPSHLLFRVSVVWLFQPLGLMRHLRTRADRVVLLKTRSAVPDPVIYHVSERASHVGQRSPFSKSSTKQFQIRTKDRKDK